VTQRSRGTLKPIQGVRIAVRGGETVYLVSVGLTTFEVVSDRDGPLRCLYCDARGSGDGSCRHIEAAEDHVMALLDTPRPVVDREMLAKFSSKADELARYLLGASGENPPVHRPALEEAARVAARLGQILAGISA